MIRHRLKYLIWITLVCLFLTSWHYQKSPLYVAKIIARAIGLHTIALAVKIHDPSPEVLIADSGPYEPNKAGFHYSSDKLLEIIGGVYPGHDLVVLNFDNKPIVSSRYRFAYQPARDSSLELLKEKYHLAELFPQNENDFEQILEIANWVHGQWLHGTSGAKEFRPGKFNADRILTRARQGDRFWCHVYSMTFIQVAASMGHQARLVSLTKDGYESSDMHAVAEVWSNFYKKWICIDIDFNIWYSKDGMPLSVLEVHDAFIGQTGSVSVVKGAKRPQPDLESRIPSLPHYYRYFYLDMRNDWLSNSYFPGHPARSDKATLFWVDKRLSPTLNLKIGVSDPAEFYWDLNRTTIAFKNSHNLKKEVELFLSTVTPNFSHFELSANGEKKMSASSTFFWPLRPGVNEISVRSVNSSGIKGVETRLTVAIKPK